MKPPGQANEVGKQLRAKFRAESAALRAAFESGRLPGRHAGEKGLRSEQVLIEFLRRHLPQKYGVSRGEVVDAQGGVSRQVDVVVYDALHSPLLQGSEASGVFPAESVYAAIELKPHLDTETLVRSLEVVRSVKALDRSAIVAVHEGHRLYHGPRRNPPPFGVVFTLEAIDLPTGVVPVVQQEHRRVKPEEWVDCVCVLDVGLVYHFAEQAPGVPGFRPAVAGPGTRLGYYESLEDTLLLFYLFLLHQLNAKELFPPDLVRYAGRLGVGGPCVPVTEVM